MTNQIKPSVTNPTIAATYQDIASNELELRPEFQRKFVWTTEHQEQFIDTILHGFPFPEIYVCTGEMNVKTLKTTRKVIDGQQRLTTIRNYIDGVQQKPFAQIKSYQNLEEDEKRAFLSYQIVMRDIGQVDDATVREIFRRINLTKFKLEDVEIHNAIYDGQFIQTAKDILGAIELEGFGVFRESEFTRMADLHFILLVMATIEAGGYFAQDKDVENKISEFNDDYPNKSEIISLLHEVFYIIKSMDLEPDSIWLRKSNFFTLVASLSFALRTGKLPNDLKERLLKFEQDILNNKKASETDYGKYYSYMFQGTQNRTARVTRSDIFKKYVLS